MPAEGPPSEFGGKIGKNTVYPKPTDVLSSSEKLRLIYLTGQEEDSTAPVRPGTFQGNGQ